MDNLQGDGFLTTTLDEVIAWARKNSLWPMPMGISCCAIEMMATASPRFDISRFGSEVMRFTPRQCDVMIVAGTVTYKMSTGGAQDLRPDARPQVGDLHGCVRILGRHVPLLLGRAGDRPVHPRGRVRRRLSAAAGSAAERADRTAEEDRNASRRATVAARTETIFIPESAS